MEVVVPDEFKHLFVQDKDHPVVKVPAEVLRQKALDVAQVSKKTQKLIDEMIAAMTKAHGIGLAAPQLGVSQRIIVVAADGMRPTPLINPVVTLQEGEQIGEEGCLSIPGLYGDVKRAAFVQVEALDRKGREVELEMEGTPARVLLHEVDHLDGVLFIDKVDLSTLHWRDPLAPQDDTAE